MTEGRGLVIGVIPARMGSSRFPGKPLAPILGMPMIGHCLLRSSMADSLDLVVVATCDQEIVDAVVELGGRAIMTSSGHETASDRTAEAIEVLEQEGHEFRTVVMIQGDEPLVRPEMIDRAVCGLHRSGAPVANLCAPLDASEADDPNEIKVVVSADRRAMYMSRLPIPFDRDGSEPPYYKQVCVIPFARDFLYKFNAMKRTPLERAESIDMLRAIEAGYSVAMVLIEGPMKSVDTPADLVEAERLMAGDDLAASYL